MHWMSKIAFSAAVAAVLVVTQSAQADDVAWQARFFDAMKTAKETKQPVLVFATMQGCQHCEKMYHESYTDEKIAGTLNRDFIPVWLDAERSEDLLERMGVEVYPTTLIYSPQGKLLGKIEGYEEKPVLRSVIQGALRHRFVSTEK